MRVLMIQNCPTEEFGWYLEWLRLEGHDATVVRAYETQDFPALDAWDAAFVGGTPHDAERFCRDVHFRREWRYLRAAIAADKACFGVDCGARVLARLLGGRARPLPRAEIGRGLVRLTPEGSADPLFAGFPTEFAVFQWHRDAFELPPGAANLASSSACAAQAFRRGRVAGVLFHLEVSSRAATAWVDAYPDHLRAAGLRRDRLLADLAESDLATRACAFRLVRNLVRWASDTGAIGEAARGGIPAQDEAAAAVDPAEVTAALRRGA
jgi:GMP synthase-like glutamine amidotransferase